MTQVRSARPAGPRRLWVDPLVRQPWWHGVLIATTSVGVAVLVRHSLEASWHFYFLPLLPAVMATALLAGRWSVALAIGLAVVANVMQVRGVSDQDIAVNSILFALISWGIAEVCQRLTQALRQSGRISHDLFVREAVLDTILTSAPIVTLDRQGHIRRITPVAAELLAVAPDAAANRPFSAFVSGFDPALLDKVGKGGILDPPPPRRWTAARPDGSVASLIIRADILPDDIEPEHAVLSLADQTQAEAVKDRGHDLALHLKRTWRLNSLGEMAATLAHELNQPLGAATVYLQAGRKALKQTGVEDDNAAEAFQLATSQLLRAGEIIRRMRDQITTGAHDLAEQRVSCLVEELAPVFTMISRDADVAIRLDIQDEDDHVLIDRIQIQQALSNLVRNAVEAVSNQHEGLVAVIGRSVQGQGYELTVEDNGPGIPKDRLDVLFQPMMTTKAGGMGLGLSVTRSIIESHGGQIIVGRSASGGASFSFRLPPITEFEAA
jgi:two-component system, LuxR family, sensor kinase FixL